MAYNLDKSNVKRIQVSIPLKQWILIEKMRGEMGNTDSEIIKNIVTSWLVDKSIISTTLKKRLENG